MRAGTRLALSAATTAALLLGLEAAARLLALPPHAFVIPTATNCLRRSPTLGMVLAPHCTATWDDASLSGSRSTTFRTNSLGLRGREVDDDGAVRILALGDSSTWGWQVAEEASYPEQLQRLLDARYGPGRYRVINAGIPGYTSYQGLTFFAEVGRALRPQIVIIAYGFNDSIRAPEVTAALARQRRLLPLLRADDVLLEHSRLWGWLRMRLSPPEPRPGGGRPTSLLAPATAWADTAPSLRVPVRNVRAYLTFMVQLARSDGARPLLLSFIGPAGPARPYASAIARVAAQLDVPLVIYDGPRLDTVHPTAAGYAALAERLLAALDQAGYLPP